MRSIRATIVLGLLAAACGGSEPAPKAPEVTPPPSATTTTTAPADTAKPETPPPAKPTMAELQAQAGKALTEGFAARDAKKIASVYADNAVMRMVGMPDVVGRDAIQSNLQKEFDAFSNTKMAPNYIFAKGDVNVVVWTWTGTHSGEFAGAKATEKPVGLLGASVMWFNQDGQIKEEHAYMDAGTIMAQIGASKVKGRAVPQLPASPQSIASKGSPEEDKNVELVKTNMSLMEAKKEKEWLDTMADSIEWDDQMAPGPMKGKEDSKKYMKMMTTAFPDGKVTATNAWGVGDFVVLEEVFTGTHKGAFMNIPATKKSLNLHGLDIVMVKDGKVQKGWSFGNSLELMTQLGLVKEPGKADAKTGDAKKPADPKPADAKKPVDAKPGDAKAPPAKK